MALASYTELPRKTFLRKQPTCPEKIDAQNWHSGTAPCAARDGGQFRGPLSRDDNTPYRHRTWKLLPEKQCVISMVARDGIEPPTPAFSGLASPAPKYCNRYT